MKSISQFYSYYALHQINYQFLNQMNHTWTIFMVLFSTATSIHLNAQNTSSSTPPQIANEPNIRNTLSQVQLIEFLYKKVSKDPQVKKLIDRNNTNSQEFRKLIFSKIIQSTRTNITVLKQLSARVYASNPLQLSQTQKQTLLLAILNDKGLTDLFAAGKQNSEQGKKEIFKRAVQLYKNNPVLTQDISKSIFSKTNITLNSAERAELFKILIQNQKLVASEQKLGQSQIKTLLENISKNQKLKDLSSVNKQNIKAFLSSV